MFYPPLCKRCRLRPCTVTSPHKARVPIQETAHMHHRHMQQMTRLTQASPCCPLKSKTPHWCHMVDALEAMNINISGVEAERHRADVQHLLACPHYLSNVCSPASVGEQRKPCR